MAYLPGVVGVSDLIHRAYRYRLYPTLEQESLLRQYAGAVRFVYNLALEQRRDWWRQYRANTGMRISMASQGRELTVLRTEIDWLEATPRNILDQGLRDLDKAFASFFADRAGYPGNRTKDRNTSFRLKAIEGRITKLNEKWSALRIPKCTPIKIRLTRPIAGVVRNMTIRQYAGTWFVSIVTEAEAKPTIALRTSTGIDRGVANTLSLSNGEHYQMPAHVSRSVRCVQAAQRAMARGKKGSARRQRMRRGLARAHAHAAAARKHWLHERSTDIARRFGIVTMEDLKVRNMTAAGGGARKRGLNRSILAQGWTAFATMLEYKVAERGGRVEYVNPAYTSQTCAECGSIDKRSRESQASFRCIDCGHTAHADTNAALNILRRSPAGVEVAGYGAVEAQIIAASNGGETHQVRLLGKADRF